MISKTTMISQTIQFASTVATLLYGRFWKYILKKFILDSSNPVLQNELFLARLAKSMPALPDKESCQPIMIGSYQAIVPSYRGLAEIEQDEVNDLRKIDPDGKFLQMYSVVTKGKSLDSFSLADGIAANVAYPYLKEKEEAENFDIERYFYNYLKEHPSHFREGATIEFTLSQFVDRQKIIDFFTSPKLGFKVSFRNHQWKGNCFPNIVVTISWAHLMDKYNPPSQEIETDSVPRALPAATLPSNPAPEQGQGGASLP